MAGMDPVRYLEATDVTESLVMAALAERYHKRMRELDQDRATMIANAVWKGLGGK